MGFYDDLKNPPKKEEPKPRPLHPVLSSAERQQFATWICESIRQSCEDANKKKKRSFRAYYDGFIHKVRQIVAPYEEYDDFSIRRFSPTICLHDKSGGEHNRAVYEDYRVSDRYWTAAERDQILPLVRKELVADGFPADAVSAHDDAYGAVGSWIFRRGGTPVYTIKVDVRW